MRQVPTSYLVRFAQLAALWAYSVSQHVFSLLEGNPEFLVVRAATRAEVVAFALSLAVAPPRWPLLASGALRQSVRASAGAALAFVGMFALPLGVYLVGQLEPETAGAVFGAVAVSIVLVNAYAMWRPVGLFLAFSVVLPVVGLASFVFNVPLAADDAQGATPRSTRSRRSCSSFWTSFRSARS